MAKHLKLFDLTSEYQAYVNGPNMILPNVSVCKDNDNTVYYNPTVVTPEGGGSEEPSVDVLQGAKILCKYNVGETNSPVKLYYQQSGSGSGSGKGEPMFSSMEVDDGSVQEVTNVYTFNKTGEHTVLFTLPEGVTSIGYRAFYDCNGLTNVTIGNSVTSIGDVAFQYCTELTSVIIGNSVTSIGSMAFSDCSKLTSVTIPNSVTSIGDRAFTECVGLTSITIPDLVTLIDEYTFNNCSKLTSVTIPNSVTSIGDGAFECCTGLTSVIIGNSVTSIGTKVFYYCHELTSITCNVTTAPTIKANTFLKVKTDGTLTVPAGSTGYDVWMGTGDYYLGKYNWTKVEA